MLHEIRPVGDTGGRRVSVDDSCGRIRLYRVAQKKRNGILPVMQVYNDWYQWMRYLLLRKIIPRSAILVKGFLF